MLRRINYKKFEQEFLETEIGKQVQKDFKYITCTNDNWPSILEVAKRYNSTCRELLGNNNLLFDKDYTTISIVTFYYLQMLQETNPKKIYDIGCGWNIWKKYMPNIIGVDDRSRYADILDKYNDQFVKKYYKKMDSAFTINMDFALKTVVETGYREATNFKTFGNHLMEFADLIKPGGRGYISVPAIGMYKWTPRNWLEEQNLNIYNPVQLTDYLEKHILEQDLKIIALDLELDILHNYPGHDGEVRVVFETHDLEI